MSWSLRLHNGDFALSGKQFGTVTDEEKLVQDLRCVLLEAMGNDDMHPSYGSLIDGGRLPDGTVVPGVIGLLNVNTVVSSVQREIQRVAQDYQNQQLIRAKSDRMTYNRVTLSAGEALLSISNIDFAQQADKLQVQVTLQTARGQDLTVVFPIASVTN